MKFFRTLKNYKFTRFNYSSKQSTNRVENSYDTKDFLYNYHNYEGKLGDISKNIEYSDDLISGHATEEGTMRYTQRNKDEVHSLNFRTLYNSGVKISSIGLGTYMGPPDDITDFYMYNAIKSVVLSGGVNVIDTAINYRYMKSEKTIGKALKALIDKYEYKRDEFFVCSKIGFVPEDASTGKRSHSFVQHLVEANKIEMDDIIFDEKNRPVHCIHPEFLKQQLNVSLSNLNLSTVDVMYLHNVYEIQGAVVNEENFEKRLGKAFEFLVYYI
jgi:diketogulonate reductase-like aldo/keto reductase